jgi:hypothetical protein
MKIWAVTEIYFNGEDDSVRIDKIFSTEKSAKDYCENNNNNRNSSYGSKWEYEVFNVE